MIISHKMGTSASKPKVLTKPKSAQKSPKGSTDSNWLPADCPVLKKMNILMIIQQFRKTYKPINLEKYGHLAIRQPLRHKHFPVVYQGTWKNDIPEGYGIFYYDSGKYYEGYITNGQLNGKGLLILENQQCYFGDFEKNRPSGMVTFQGQDVSFKGHFIEGEELVKGEIISKKEGKKITVLSRQYGIIEYQDGVRYEGRIEGRFPCGLGKLFYAAQTYQGDVSYNRKRNGTGLSTWEEGLKYYGHYKDNDKHGWGRFYHTPYLYEECQWSKGLKVSQTFIYYKLNLVYQGAKQEEINQIIEQYQQKT